MNKEKNTNPSIHSDIILLEKFNKRDCYAFTTVYNRFYNDFHLYAASLYCNTTVDPADAVQDVFLYVLQHHELQFDSLLNLKAYIVIAIKNRFKNHVEHSKYEKSYRHFCSSDEIERRFKLDVVETRIYSYMEEALGVLPEECAKVFKLYLNGYKPEEIAEVLDKSIQTVYNTKQRAISILKKRLKNENFFSLFLLLGW